MAKLILNDTQWDFVFVAGNEQVATHCPTFEAMLKMAELDTRLKSSTLAADQLKIIPELRAALKEFVSPGQTGVIDSLGVDDVFQVFLAVGNYWMEHIKKKTEAARASVWPLAPKNEANAEPAPTVKS